MGKRVEHPIDKTNPLRLYVNQPDRARIKALAEAHGMTTSKYLRCVALDRKVKPVVDPEVIGQMARIAEQQKGMAERLTVLVNPRDRAALLAQIEIVQGQLIEAAKRIRT